MASAAGAASQVLITGVADWLIQKALIETPLDALVMGTCERLHAAGIPLVRGFFSFSTLHPLHRAIGVTWERGGGTTIEGYEHVPGGVSEQYRQSPHFYMLERELEVLRIRLDCCQRDYTFPVLDELRKTGITDYLAFLVPFEATFPTSTLDGPPMTGMAGSWATDRASGFSESELEALLRIRDRLGIASKLAIKSQLMTNLTRTYLGGDPGRRVLNGQIKRGDLEAIEAAIWYSDLRGSTAMADQFPPQDYVDALNSSFEAIGGPVTEAGGEILSFTGDGMLAVFTSRDGEQNLTPASRRAAQAAVEASERMALLNIERKTSGQPVLGYGVGLHLGRVLYGNVGVPERLTFSAFGAAVNEVTRIEELTKTLPSPILASEAFRECAGIEGWPHLGAHALRGVAQSVDVYDATGTASPSKPDGS